MTVIVRENPANVFAELPFGQSIPSPDGTVLHAWQITDLWSDADLATEHIYRVAPAVVPQGKIVSATGYQRVNGTVTQILTLADEVPVGQRVASPRQIRLALNQQGLRQACENWVASQAQDVKDNWDYATFIKEDNPLIIACMNGIGKTQADLTALFDLAVAIQ
jgi:predicted protein tyrosine phosphatase